MAVPPSAPRVFCFLLICCCSWSSTARGDSIAQEAYFKASNTEAEDWFGYSVAACGGTMVVGAPWEDSAATGVNGDESDNSAPQAGAAYVFVRNGPGGGWSQQAYLKASNTDPEDYFGWSVGISGDIVVVGAVHERSLAIGIDGDGSDNSALRAGAAYVFVRSGTTWSQQAYLKASNTDIGDQFGRAVAIHGDTVVVGAVQEDSRATGVNGDQSSDTLLDSGAVYVFVRSGGSWSQQAYLKALDTDRYDYLGWPVAISDDVIVVGAYGEDSSATGVDGDPSDDSAWSSGAAYVFARSGTIWYQQAYLKASNTGTNDGFGQSLAVSGDTVVVGALCEDSGATGVDGDPHDESALYSGAAYVYVRTGATWSHQAYLKASNTELLDQFGVGVTVSGDTLAIGASDEDSRAFGLDGDQSDNNAPSSGAVYLFARNGSLWTQHAYLKASNVGAYDWFGRTLASTGDTFLVAAPAESSAATGVDGDQDDDGAPISGAAYIFTAPHPGAGFCFGDPGSGAPCPCTNDNDGSVPGSGCGNGMFASGARLAGSGSASLAHDTLVLTTIHQEPHSQGLYFQADGDLSPGIVWGNGLRCAGGNLRRLQTRQADAAGTSFTTVGIPSAAGNVAAGDTKLYQCWYRNTINPPCGAGWEDYNLSNGYAVTWGP